MKLLQKSTEIFMTFSFTIVIKTTLHYSFDYTNKRHLLINFNSYHVVINIYILVLVNYAQFLI